MPKDKKIESIGCIPDGQRRFARRFLDGDYRKAYQKGYRTLIDDFLPVAEDYDVQNVLIYGFSNDNYERDIGKDILDFEEEKLRELLNGDLIYNKKLNVKMVSSSENKLPRSLREVARKIYEATKDYTKRNLRILIGYSMEKQITQKIPLSEDTKVKIGDILGFNEIDEIDLVLRSGARHSYSGFPHSDYTELYVFDKLFPELEKEDFRKAFEWYKKQRQKRGK